jgi:hypothetical protein
MDMLKKRRACKLSKERGRGGGGGGGGGRSRNGRRGIKATEDQHSSDQLSFLWKMAQFKYLGMTITNKILI